MLVNQEGKFLSIGEAAKQIGRSPRTIKNWYEWAELTGYDLLPKMYNGFDKKGTRYFREEDVAKLEEFKNSIKYGQMAKISRTKWGERGRKVGEKSEQN